MKLVSREFLRLWIVWNLFVAAFVGWIVVAVVALRWAFST